VAKILFEEISDSRIIVNLVPGLNHGGCTQEEEEADSMQGRRVLGQESKMESKMDALIAAARILSLVLVDVVGTMYFFSSKM
jgi:hypothetical protein